MLRFARSLPRRLGVCLLAVLCIAPAQAQMRAMSDGELASVSGQGLFEVSNSSLNGFDFTRIALDADVTLNANLKNIRLGEYNYAARNGTGADIDITAFQFGRSDGTSAQRTVQISKPYFEFVYQGTGAAREVIGMRLGFDSIAGDIGTRIASLSGSVRIDTGASGIIDTNNDTAGGKRWDNTCATCTGPALAQVGAVTAGDATGPSRDFWIAILKAPVQFPAANGMPALTPAQAGIWMNWRDKVTALNLTAQLPPNLPPMGH